MIIRAKINTAEDVYNLSAVACEQPYDMFVSCEHNIFDARSLLALHVLVGKEVNIVAPDRVDPDKFMKAVKKMGLEM